MLAQLLPGKGNLSLGSKKLFHQYFKPSKSGTDLSALKQYILSTTKAAYRIFILWGLLIAALGVLYHSGILQAKELFLVSVVFYVCDLICVLFWCPFRLLLKKPLLYHLQNLQLGSCDDVHTHAVRQQFLLPKPAAPVGICMARMGAECFFPSRALLGTIQ